MSIRNREQLKRVSIKAWLPVFVLLIHAIVLIRTATDVSAGGYSIPGYYVPAPTMRDFATVANEMTTGYVYRGAGVRVFYLQIALVVIGIIGLSKRYRRGAFFLSTMYVGL